MNPDNPDLITSVNASVDRALARAAARKDKIIEQQKQIAGLQSDNSNLLEQVTAMSRELDRMEAELEAIKAKIDAAEPEVGGSTGDV